MTGLRAALSRCSHVAAAVLLASLLAASLSFAQEQAESSHDRGQGVVEIEGRAIETLTLTSATGVDVTLTKPRDGVDVPVGRYRVTQVVLAEGYHCDQGYTVNGSDWFTVTADSPTKLAVGAPLISTVTASRQGSVLKLDYTLVDAAGRKYSPGTTSAPPTFNVFKGDRQVGSGTFEYG
jgi:hypothetical protein